MKNHIFAPPCHCRRGRRDLLVLGGTLLLRMALGYGTYKRDFFEMKVVEICKSKMIILIGVGVGAATYVSTSHM